MAFYYTSRMRPLYTKHSFYFINRWIWQQKDNVYCVNAQRCYHAVINDLPSLRGRLITDVYCDAADAMFWTIWWKRKGQLANFLANTPFTLQRCLAELMDIFRCVFFCSNPKMLLEVIGYFDFPKLSSKTCESELLFARDSKVSKILKWRTF